MTVVDPSIVTSRLFVVVERVYTTLLQMAESNQFPPHPRTGGSPRVYLGHDPNVDPEYLTVQTAPPETANEWTQASPAKRNENFVVRIGVRTNVVAQTDQLAAWRRLGDLVGAVEGVWYDTVQGRPSRLELNNVTLHRVGQVDAAIVEHSEGQWRGAAVVDLYVESLI